MFSLSRQHLLIASFVLAGFAVLGRPDRAAAAGGGRLVLTVVDRDSGKPIPCRMHLRAGGGRPRGVPGLPFWNDHVALPGRVTLDLPKGDYAFELERGLEYVTRSGRFTIDHFADDAKEVDLKRFVDMSARGWWSGDLDVRREPGQIELVMQAEDLHVAALIESQRRKSKTPPDAAAPSPKRFDDNRYYSTATALLAWPGTRLVCLNVEKPPAAPAAGEVFPAELEQTLTAIHEQPGAWIDLSSPTAWDMPTLVALGLVDSIQLAGGSICRDRVIDRPDEGRPRDRKRFPGVRGGPEWDQEVYFRLLDCGLRIPPSAGSASGEAPNPVGYNRMYVHVGGEFGYDAWWQGLRAGRATITNGPLMEPDVDGHVPGHVFQASEGEAVELEIGLTLSTREPISYLEIVQDGQVAQSIRFDEYQKSGRLPKVRFERSGWFLLRAVTDLPNTYRFAMTGPYHVEIGPARRISRADAQFFLDWVYDRARMLREEIADPAARQAALAPHRKARDFWQRLVERASAE
ncbi:MAG: hypothetical protein JW809_13390 [Pirellulales bacterium]|nr:hypothetical protein [Pirellulales bacterium]